MLEKGYDIKIWIAIDWIVNNKNKEANYEQLGQINKYTNKLNDAWSFSGCSMRSKKYCGNWIKNKLGKKTLHNINCGSINIYWSLLRVKKLFSQEQWVY